MISFIGRCDQLECSDLEAFDESAESISNREFRQLLGSDRYQEFEKSLGYGKWLRLSKDWHVSYERGEWMGKPAICCHWSAFHHIWTLESKLPRPVGNWALSQFPHFEETGKLQEERNHVSSLSQTGGIAPNWGFHQD